MALQPFKPIYQQRNEAIALITKGYQEIRQQEAEKEEKEEKGEDE